MWPFNRINWSVEIWGEWDPFGPDFWGPQRIKGQEKSIRSIITETVYNTIIRTIKPLDCCHRSFHLKYRCDFLIVCMWLYIYTYILLMEIVRVIVFVIDFRFFNWYLWTPASHHHFLFSILPFISYGGPHKWTNCWLFKCLFFHRARICIRVHIHRCNICIYMCKIYM